MDMEESPGNNIRSTAAGAGIHRKRAEKYNQRLLPYIEKAWEVGQHDGRALEEWPREDYEINDEDLFLVGPVSIRDLSDGEVMGLAAVYAGGKLRGYLEVNERDILEVFDRYYRIGEENSEVEF